MYMLMIHGMYDKLLKQIECFRWIINENKLLQNSDHNSKKKTKRQTNFNGRNLFE